MAESLDRKRQRSDKESPKKSKKIKNENKTKHKKDKTKKKTKPISEDPDSFSVLKNERPSKIREPTFPFFTQTVSLWLPVYPVGFDRPISSVANQHLNGLINHYSPLLGGYLLAYRNVNLSENSVRADPRKPPLTDETPATLVSIDEYAVGFGWMTVDVDLFVPIRGSWLEGTVILQNEGSIGLNCWEKFNASIEAARLPQGWHYVDVETTCSSDMAQDEESQTSGRGGQIDPVTADEAGENGVAQDSDLKLTDNDHEAVSLHPTGFWADESGNRIAGTILFRIKDFDVGLAGENGYMAIEGTLLSESEEHEQLAQERSRKMGNGWTGKTRRLPEFSITRFGREDEEEESGRRLELYKGSRPVTPDD